MPTHVSITKLTLAAALALFALAACEPEPLPKKEGGNGNNNNGGNGGRGGSGGGGTGGTGTGGTGGVVVPCGGACGAGETCSEATDTCIPIESCEPACAAGFLCESGVCVAAGGGIGTPCSTGTDCSSGLCATSLSGEALCVAPCGVACPAGTHCVESAQLCMGDQNAACTGVDSCGGTASCTFWELSNGTSFSSCSLEAGGTFEGLPCTTGADCRTGLCSAPNEQTGERVCTAPCVDDFGCTAMAGTLCVQQEVLTPGLSMTRQACAAPVRLNGFAECCATDADCDPVETLGCRVSQDGTNSSCASVLECTTNEDCFFFVAGQSVEGDCIDSHCVARACLTL